MTEMFGEAWSPMSVPDLAPDDDNDDLYQLDKDCPVKQNLGVYVSQLDQDSRTVL